MKKILIFLLMMTVSFTLSALDLRLKNGRVLNDFSGLGTVAPVPRTNLGRWGVIVYYQNGKRRAVVEVKDFPNDFPHMRAVQQRAALIPKAKAKAITEQKEMKQEEKEELERKKRLQKIANANAKGVPVNLPKKSAKGTKKKQWKKSGD